MAFLSAKVVLSQVLFRIMCLPLFGCDGPSFVPACGVLTGVTQGGRRCAWHGHWIGGESPLRGELVATASRRQLHAGICRRETPALAPRGRVGKKPEANRSTERK